MIRNALLTAVLAFAVAVPIGVTAASAHPKGPPQCWWWHHHHWVWVCKPHHYWMNDYDYQPYYFGPSFGFFLGDGDHHHHHDHHDWDWKKQH